MKTTQQASIGLQGYVKVEVIDHAGKVIEERPWQPNLILDQGLDALADNYIAQLFEHAAAGTGTSIGWETKETVPTGNTYTSNGSGNLARVGGSTRDFTADDIGKLVKRVDGPKEECIINGFTSATSVSVRKVGESGTVPTYTAKNIVIYSVHRKGLETEVGLRTHQYSAVSGHNSTIDTLASGKRTLKRTFVFPAMDEIKEPLLGSFYTASDVNAANVTITHSSGGRNFVPEDVGKILWYPGINKGARIVTQAGVSCTIDNTPDLQLTAGHSAEIDIYDGIKYSEVGFSHDSTAGDNLNIRVRIENASGVVTPIPVMGPYPGTPSQQLRVTYKLEVTVTPTAITPGNSNINDPDDLMSTNKSGDSVIELLALSSVNSDGTSNITLASLEPKEAAHAGLSPLSAPLATMGSGTTVDRAQGAASTLLVATPYVPDKFERIYEGTFGINEGISPQNGWWVLGIFDFEASVFPFCFKFNVKQEKSAEVSLIVRFIKSWNRALT